MRARIPARSHSAPCAAYFIAILYRTARRVSKQAQVKRAGACRGERTGARIGERNAERMGKHTGTRMGKRTAACTGKLTGTRMGKRAGACMCKRTDALMCKHADARKASRHRLPHMPARLMRAPKRRPPQLQRTAQTAEPPERARRVKSLSIGCQNPRESSRGSEPSRL